MHEVDTAALVRECMIVILKLGGPVLCVALVVGLIVSVLQAVTQINEAMLAFLPKLAAIGFALMLFGPFMATTLSNFARTLFDRIVAIGGS
ncbi:MAG: flagellar biosynthesis protein FliQ [Rhodopila sp.]|jgi:flagellar biosynthetic protein FliQ